jgi:hypothetical protein
MPCKVTETAKTYINEQIRPENKVLLKPTSTYNFSILPNNTHYTELSTLDGH